MGDTLSLGQTQLAPSDYTFADHISAVQIGASLGAEDQGSRPVWDRLADIPTKFVPLTGAAIFNSFANTAVDVGNFLGADWHRFTIEDEFGPDSETTKYYQQNSGIVEGTALAVGSLAPGLAGIKVLKLAQMGKFGSSFQTATGLFSGMREGALAEAQIAALGNSTGTSLFGQTQLQTVKALLGGVGDNALQGAAYEIATLATMHANPITDSNTILDNVKDVATSAVMFGAFGGIVDGAKGYMEIRKGVREADISTKAYEKFGAKGLGNITPGDRVVALYDTLDQIPEATTRLEKMKSSFTTNTTQRMIRDQLIKAADGDTRLAGAFHSFLEKNRVAGLLPTEELVNQIGSLKKIGPYDGLEITSKSEDVFFINPKVSATDIQAATVDDIFAKEAAGDALTSRAYTLRDPKIQPTIARGTDTISVPDIKNPSQSMEISKWQNIKEAYNSGADIFIDRTGKVHINPQSNVIEEVAAPGESRKLSKAEREAYRLTGKLPPGSAPLEGIGTTVDMQTGKIYRNEAPPAVLGDLGTPKLVENGKAIQAGDQTFAHSAGDEFLPTEINPLEANSRYVWADKRGLKKGDVIDGSDLPMLETLYRDLKTKGEDAINKLNVEVLSDQISLPISAEDLLSHIASKKQEMYADMLQAGKGADEISRVLNAPTKGMTKNFNNVSEEELMFAPETSLFPRHARLAYDIGTIKNDEGNLLQGMMGLNYRMKVAADTNTNTVANFFGKSLSKQDPTGKMTERMFAATKIDGDASNADILGAGNGFFRSANADYNTLAQRVERSGRAVGEFIQIARKQMADVLLAPINKLRTDPLAGAEFGNIQAVAHSTGEHWVLHSPEQLAEWGLPRNTMLLEGAVSIDKQAKKLVWNPDYVPPNFSKGTVLPEGQTTAVNGPKVPTSGGINLQTLYTLSDTTTDLIRAHRDLVNERNSFRSDFFNSQGLSKPTFPAERVYFPPIDTSRYPYMAYVRNREGFALGESGSSVITAKNAEDLQKKIALLGPEYETLTKGQIGDLKKFQGEFDWNRNFADSKINSEMRRKGILNDIVPETRTSNLVDNLVNWHFRQQEMLIRDHVELHNAATFAQLGAMGDRWAQTGASRFGAVHPLVERQAPNPYNSYIKEALGLSNRDNYPLWQKSQDILQAFGDHAFNAVRDAFGAAKKGILPWEEAQKVSERFGLGNPYGTALEELSKASYYGGLSNQLPEAKLLSKYVGVSNTTLAATTIRLDVFQQLIDAVTFPIISSLEYLSATKELKTLTSVTVPTTVQSIPAFSRVMYNAVRNFWKDDGTLSALYTKAAGLQRDEIHVYRSMIDDLTLPLGPLSKDGWTQKLDNAVQKAEGLMGTKFTNRFLHFMASDIGRQMGEAAGQSGQELMDTIGTFTARTLGTQTANQKAAIFSGPVGQALGLFQSFNWNVMQQLLRHVGNGDAKAIAVAAGMQSTIFGVSTLPGFAQLNSLIAGRHGNESGEDVYSGITGMLGKDIASYLLYGSLSGLTGTSFYDRGDLNPRRLTLLPVNPLDFPSVSAGIRVYQNLAQLGANLTNGSSDATSSLLLAAEHNGLSRPLAGLSQLMQGYSTDNSGRLISSNSGMNDIYNIANMSRLLGAKPLDEAIAGDALRRIQAVQVKDTARLSSLGSAAMTSLYAGGEFSSYQTQRLLEEYARAGGSQDNFNGWFLDKVKNANIPVANQVMNNFHNPRNQTLMKMMGGLPLPGIVPEIHPATSFWSSVMGGANE